MTDNILTDEEILDGFGELLNENILNKMPRLKAVCSDQDIKTRQATAREIFEAVYDIEDTARNNRDFLLMLKDLKAKYIPSK